MSDESKATERATRFAGPRDGQRNERVGSIKPGPEREVFVERVHASTWAVRVGFLRRDFGLGMMFTVAEARELAALLIRATTSPARLSNATEAPSVQAARETQAAPDVGRVPGRFGVPRGRTSPK